MKPSPRFALTLLLPLLLTLQGYSQCVLQRVVYDTTVNGTGTQDPGYNFNVPKFNGMLGTLTEVKVTSVVSLSFSFTIENPNPSPKSPKFRMVRTDDISSSALASPLFSSKSSPSASTFYGPYSLAAADATPNSGADFIAGGPYPVFNNDTIINQTVYNTADYLGSGSVSFTYSPSIGTLMFPVNQGLDPNISAIDRVKFAVTYTYCNNIALATDITAFTAVKQNDVVAINWFTDNERNDRNYELLKSYDGKTFTHVKDFTSQVRANQSGVYNYSYLPASSEKGKVIFRLKQTESAGQAKYSALRVVDLGNEEVKSGIRLFPNPSNGNVTVVFNDASRSDWQLDVYSLSGQLVQRQEALNSIVVRLDNKGTLRPGIYMVKATNKKTLKNFVEKLVIN